MQQTDLKYFVPIAHNLCFTFSIFKFDDIRFFNVGPYAFKNAEDDAKDGSDVSCSYPSESSIYWFSKKLQKLAYWHATICKKRVVNTMLKTEFQYLMLIAQKLHFLKMWFFWGHWSLHCFLFQSGIFLTPKTCTTTCSVSYDDVCVTGKSIGTDHVRLNAAKISKIVNLRFCYMSMIPNHKIENSGSKLYAATM